jgi:hypothetical protein
VQAQAVANVREGPGTAYEVVATMRFLQVNLITGRAGDAAWWQIRLDNGALGWIADEVVSVQGYTGNVPVVSAPATGGATATPGAPWDPTPRSSCKVTATNTATATPQETGMPSPNVSPTSPQGEPTSSVAGDGATIPASDGTVTADSLTRQPPATATVDSAPATNPNPASPQAAVTADSSDPIDSAADARPPTPENDPLPGEAPSRLIDLLPIAGGILLLLGIALSLARRRQGKES